jgi:hypothetical protein
VFATGQICGACEFALVVYLILAAAFYEVPVASAYNDDTVPGGVVTTWFTAVIAHVRLASEVTLPTCEYTERPMFTRHFDADAGARDVFVSPRRFTQNLVVTPRRRSDGWIDHGTFVYLDRA